MQRAARRFSLAFLVIACAVSSALWVMSYHQHPWYDGRRLAGDVRIGAFDGSFWVFNTESPYQGSIISVSSPGFKPDYPKCWGASFPGIYIRHFFWPNKTVWSAA